MPTYSVEIHAPNVKEFCHLRSLVGWGDTDPRLAELSLKHSLFNVCVYQGVKLIASGRVVGDGYMYFYVQDVIVHPAHQAQGLGKLVMERIEEYLAKVAKKGATIGLLSAIGKEGFYQRFGYHTRPSQSMGAGMVKFIT